MDFIRNTRISARVAVGFAAVLALMLSLTIVSIYRVNSVNTSLSVMNDFNSVKQRYAINFRGSVHDRAIRVRDITLVDASEQTPVLNDISRLENFYGASEVKLDTMFDTRSDMTDEERGINGEIKAAQARAMPALKKVVELQLQGDLKGAHAALMGEARPAFIAWLAAINKFIDLEEKKNHDIAASVRAVTQGFQLQMILLCGCALMVGCAFAWWSISSVRPLLGLTVRIRSLAAGDLSVIIPQANGVDEVSEIARAVLVFKEALINAEAAARREAEERVAKERRTAALEASVRRFEDKVGTMTRTLAAAATELEGTSHKLATSAERTNAESIAAEGASQTTSANVNTVASATEELSASVREIGNQVARSRTIAGEAITQSQESGATVKRLAVSAESIGEVVRLIASIASQTNLLALNATIEAARAGESGKGFAVVASEVKSLASQTQKATVDIEAKINEVQSLTGQTVTAIDAVGRVIETMAEITASIAAAVEEQGAATAEIARSVQEAANGTEGVSRNIVGVREAAASSGAAANQVLSASSELSQQAEMLNREVGSFIGDVKAA